MSDQHLQIVDHQLLTTPLVAFCCALLGVAVYVGQRSHLSSARRDVELIRSCLAAGYTVLAHEVQTQARTAARRAWLFRLDADDQALLESDLHEIVGPRP